MGSVTILPSIEASMINWLRGKGYEVCDSYVGDGENILFRITNGMIECKGLNITKAKEIAELISKDSNLDITIKEILRYPFYSMDFTYCRVFHQPYHRKTYTKAFCERSRVHISCDKCGGTIYP